MSAAELIEQIKILPPGELEKVRNFLLEGAPRAQAEQEVKYMDRESARKVGEKVMEKHDELLRKLAQ